MSQQFSNPPVGDSADAFKNFMDVLEDVASDQTLIRITEWAEKACKFRIVDTEYELIRLERFGYTDDAAHAQHYLENCRKALKVIQACRSFLLAATKEDFNTIVSINRLAEDNAFDVAVPGQEIKTPSSEPQPSPLEQVAAD